MEINLNYHGTTREVMISGKPYTNTFLLSYKDWIQLASTLMEINPPLGLTQAMHNSLTLSTQTRTTTVRNSRWDILTSIQMEGLSRKGVAY